MTQLHGLLAVMADTTNAAAAIQAETINTFNKKPDHFKGSTRNVLFLDDNRTGENTSDTKELVSTVHDKIGYTFNQVGRHYDVLLQLEEANSRAKADLVVDGQLIAKDLPATFLLGMENRLKALRDVLFAIPTIEPSITWSDDEVSGVGVYRSAPLVSFKTEKVLKSKVLYEATKEHPAQIEKWTEDTAVAKIETVHKSGMLSPLDKSAMLGRMDKMITAVKLARQKANSVEVNNIHVSQDLFKYILGK